MASASLLRDGLQFVLQHRDAAGMPRCRGFRGLPTTEAEYLCVVGPSEAIEAQLGDDIAASLLATSSSIVEVRDGYMPCGGRSSGTCHALGVPHCHKTIAIIVDGSGAPIHVASVPSTPGRRVDIVPVLAGGATATHLPASLRKRNAIAWTPGDRAAASRLVQRAGVASRTPRLFLSYVRKDTSELADQLFDELHRQGFDVFLDRFRIPPGADFHVKIAEELSDKAVVLVLESPHLYSSKWVRHEVGFARAHRLGVVAIRLPRAPTIPEIDKDWRRSVAPKELTPRGRLKPTALKSVTYFIRAVHLAAESWRRGALRDAMSDSLARAGLTNQQLRATDVVLATHPSSGNRYAFRMACYPPTVEDYCVVAPERSGPATAYVVGPAKHMDAHRRAHNEWISDESKIELCDESEILALPRRLR